MTRTTHAPSIVGAFACVIATLVPSAAWAHPSPHATVLLELRENDVAAEIHLPVPEVEAALGRSPTEVDRDAIAAMVDRDLHATARDGARFATHVDGLRTGQDGGDPVWIVDATLTPPAGASPRAFTLTNDVIGSAVPNHTAWIALRNAGAAPPDMLGVTRYLHHEITVDRREPPARGTKDLIALGARHIAEGTDHLSFLLALLLVAPLAERRGRWGRALVGKHAMLGVLRVVTAFTLGHSLTLALSALGRPFLPTSIVEIAIAISVLVSAVHAVRPIFPRREAWVAGAFGLVHGLAFASALAEMKLTGAQLVGSVLAFNVGIEAMQMAIIAFTLPWLLLLGRTAAYGWFRVVLGGATAVAALGWMLERALGVSSPATPIVDTAASHPLALLTALATGTLAARPLAPVTRRRPLPAREAASLA